MSSRRKATREIPAADTPAPRRRLAREDRYRQLLDASWRLIGEEGTEALSLGRLAEAAGVTKPVVYDHFGTRAGLLAALYQDFDSRQSALMDEALRHGAEDLPARAHIIASCFVDCVLSQGREIPGVVAALTGSPEMERIKREYQGAFMAKCHGLLAPFAPRRALPAASLWALLGAAESLSYAAAAGAIDAAQARHALADLVIAIVQRGEGVPA
ncbi:AcrR family transcriptional regulator [Pseudoxanthomonas sp. OG2]|nr:MULTISPECIES: TetR/AcrR family transcriptional regulator [unclassified Pseudoxanthomonas]MBB3275394.1 AcrR family transcriptional regulator [Pseudoxanthomonas sp. OG2]MBD9376982.1 TetR/AcrR family transcriptional regulator [Pseudoxanthomonas sp. PXM04]